LEVVLASIVMAFVLWFDFGFAELCYGIQKLPCVRRCDVDQVRSKPLKRAAAGVWKRGGVTGEVIAIPFLRQA
jgi:hypothetical protein